MGVYLKYHLIAFCSGFILDLLIGDPKWLYHPVRIIGGLISFLDKKLRREDEQKDNRIRGGVTALIVCSLTLIVSFLILAFSYKVNLFFGCAFEAFMSYQILASRSLYDESMKVYKALEEGNIEKSRYAVSMIVGRDTEELDEQHIAAAAVETVAENTSDGVIAPMLYLFIGGPCMGFLYKAINTMDSMIGYKNDKYIDFGRCAAKTDDVVNFIPSRISAFLILLSATLISLFGGKEYYSASRGYKIYKRDRLNHASPNSAQTEAACAGVLGLRLAGDASYFGKIVKKPYIGDKIRDIEIRDIKRANLLMLVSSTIFMVLLSVILLAICIC